MTRVAIIEGMDLPLAGMDFESAPGSGVLATLFVDMGSPFQSRNETRLYDLQASAREDLAMRLPFFGSLAAVGKLEAVYRRGELVVIELRARPKTRGD